MDFQPVKASDKEIIDKYVERLLFIRVYSV